VNIDDLAGHTGEATIGPAIFFHKSRPAILLFGNLPPVLAQALCFSQVL